MIDQFSVGEVRLMIIIAPIHEAVMTSARPTSIDEAQEAAAGEAVHHYARFSQDLGLYVTMAMNGNVISSVHLTETEPEDRHGRDHPYLSRIVEHLATGNDPLTDLPVDLRVSGFELEVLEVLRTIPPGEVVTYGEIARRLGRPRAMRAVGNACAKNPVVVVIPCHRVVPASGGVGSYSGAGGPETKVRLLNKEGAMIKVKKGMKGAGSFPPGARPKER